LRFALHEAPEAAKVAKYFWVVFEFEQKSFEGFAASKLRAGAQRNS
jgi:hypothetical protein